jgi:hypothetical protein
VPAVGAALVVTEAFGPRITTSSNHSTRTTPARPRTTSRGRRLREASPRMRLRGLRRPPAYSSSDGRVATGATLDDGPRFMVEATLFRRDCEWRAHDATECQWRRSARNNKHASAVTVTVTVNVT